MSPHTPAPESRQKDRHDGEPTLSRSLGFLDATAIVVGIIVGAGVFLVPRDVYLAVGSPMSALAVWVLGAGLSLCGVMLMAELGAMYPAAGGLAAYFKRAYGDIVAFLFTWTFFVAINAGVIAGLATAAGEYIIPGTTMEARKHAGIVVVLTLSLLSLLGITLGKRIQNAMTITKIAGIVLVALLLFGHRMHATPPSAAVAERDVTVSGFFVGFVAVLWAFDGWAWIGFSAEEMRRPAVDLPRALLCGIGVVAALYVALCASVYFSLEAEQIQKSGRPVVDAVQHSMGTTAARAVNLIVLVSILGSLNGVILTGPRSLFALARDGYFFNACARIGRRYRTPYVAILVQSLWVVLLIQIADFEQLLTLVVFAAWLFYVLLGAAVPILRYREPLHSRPYSVRAPGTLAVLFSVSAILVLASIVQDDPSIALTTIGLIFCGVPIYIYFALRLRERAHDGGQLP